MYSQTEELTHVLNRTRSFEREAHLILGRHEAAASRTVLLSESYRKLTGLSLLQDELFREALRCVEEGLYRSAHVMAWAGFIDWLQNELVNNHVTTLNAARPLWKITSVDDLRESISEFQQVDACRAVGLCGKTVAKALQGLLNKRNECAHPSTYSPDLNETLGFISESFKRLERLRKKGP